MGYRPCASSDCVTAQIYVTPHGGGEGTSLDSLPCLSVCRVVEGRKEEVERGKCGD